MISIVKAAHHTHFKTIEVLANTIWREHYTALIGKTQVDYMLQKFQSEGAIKTQIDHGYRYYILMFEAVQIGYLSVKKEQDDLFLSKFYILEHYRYKGIGRAAMDFIEDLAKTEKCSSISLTVNKTNNKTIKIYKALGFKHYTNIVIDIGNGFVMDDYKMMKVLTP